MLRFARNSEPWSVWLFWDDAWSFEGWYLNLEPPRVRDGRRVVTCDHMLDVWVAADGTATLKDEDELEAAVEQGRFTPDAAASIRADGESALAAWRAGGHPFDVAWTRWRPDPDWPVPPLPAGARWDVDVQDELRTSGQ